MKPIEVRNIVRNDVMTIHVGNLHGDCKDGGDPLPTQGGEIVDELMKRILCSSPIMIGEATEM